MMLQPVLRRKDNSIYEDFSPPEGELTRFKIKRDDSYKNLRRTTLLTTAAEKLTQQRFKVKRDDSFEKSVRSEFLGAGMNYTSQSLKNYHTALDNTHQDTFSFQENQGRTHRFNSKTTKTDPMNHLRSGRNRHKGETRSINYNSNNERLSKRMTTSLHSGISKRNMSVGSSESKVAPRRNLIMPVGNVSRRPTMTM